MSRLVTVSLFMVCLFGCNNAEQAPEKVATAAATLEPAAAVGGDIDLVKRGAQLVNLGGCGDCHTPMHFDPALQMPVKSMDRMLSGHPVGAPEPASEPGKGDQAVIGATFTAFRLPFGVVYAANLTPDKETGLGNWNVSQFIATMRTGHHQGAGRPLLPPMPWQNLASATDADLTAMFSFLQTIPAVNNKVPAPNVPPPVFEAFAKNNADTAKAISQL